MAATNYVFEGGTVTLFIDGTAVAYAVSDDVNISHTTRLLRNKTDGRWPVRKQGTYDANGTCNVLYAILDDEGAPVVNIKNVVEDLLAGTEVTLKVTNDNAGDYEFTGPAQWSGVAVSFGMYGENAEGNFSWEAAGEWTQSVIS